MSKVGLNSFRTKPQIQEKEKGTGERPIWTFTSYIMKCVELKISFWCRMRQGHPKMILKQKSYPDRLETTSHCHLQSIQNHLTVKFLLSLGISDYRQPSSFLLKKCPFTPGEQIFQLC